jgi:uncharacterized protein YhaN
MDPSDVAPTAARYSIMRANLLTYHPSRLRLTDVKAGHFERKVQALENERDQWESKYEEMAKKFADMQKQLEEFQAEMAAL